MNASKEATLESIIGMYVASLEDTYLETGVRLNNVGDDVAYAMDQLVEHLEGYRTTYTIGQVFIM